MMILMDVCKFSMSTPQDNIIEKLESEIESLKIEIFDLKGELKITESQLKEAIMSCRNNKVSIMMETM